MAGFSRLCFIYKTINGLDLAQGLQSASPRQFIDGRHQELVFDLGSMDLGTFYLSIDRFPKQVYLVTVE